MTLYKVDYLIGLSRLPDRFYALVYGLSGRDAIYNNPGVSLRSFVIGNCIREEIVFVENKELETIIYECEAFNEDKNVLNKINESLVASATQLTIQITSQILDDKLIEDVTKLHEYGQKIKLTYDAFMSTQLPETAVNLWSTPGMMYKQSLIDMQNRIEDVTDKLNEELEKKEPPKDKA